MTYGQPRAATREQKLSNVQQGKASAEKAQAKSFLSRPFSVVRAVMLLVLLPAWVDVVELNLSPVYGSIPAAKWRRLLADIVCFAGVAIAIWLFPPSAKTARTHLNWIPLIAFGNAYILHAYLYRASSSLGPMWGPIITKAIVQIPLILCSSIEATKLLKAEHRSLPWAVMVGIPWVYEPGASLDLLSRSVGHMGSNVFLTRSGLLVCLALLFIIACSPAQSLKTLIRWFGLAALVTCYFLVYNQHGPSSLSLETANQHLHSSQYIILEREESFTGYVSVLEDKRQNIRFLRCDHSLLGGNWLVDEVSIQHGMKHAETIFSVFVMLEAVRLMVPVSRAASSTSDPKSALVVGLGIGTSPTAFSKHGLNTTVVELDPAVTRMARKYFGLPSEVIVHDEDALAFVSRESKLQKRYDIIVHDVFTGGAEPISLFTTEFLGMLKSLLTSTGSIAVNYGGDLKRESTWLVLRTIASTLGNCKAFRDHESSGGSASDFANFVVFCKPGQGKWVFRDPLPADFLESLTRQTGLLPRIEVDLGASVHRNLLSRQDTESQRVVKASHERSAADHWHIMRGLMPDIVWETW